MASLFLKKERLLTKLEKSGILCKNIQAWMKKEIGVKKWKRYQ